MPSQPEKIFQQNSNNGIYSMPLVATHNSPHYNNREIENLQSRPNDVSQGERKTFENNSPSTEVKAFPSIPIFGGGIMLNNDWFIDKLSMVG
jgi:hypothetical protein